MQELRRHSRIALDLPITYSPKGSTDPLQARSRDLSIGGMFIKTESPPVFGTEVTIQIKLPTMNEAFVIPAVVRWLEPEGMGVQFGPLGARETYAITEALKAPG